ncbi:MAG TPA: hypothetical protein VKB96_02815, partial [Gammaproteobacteria bacterium]|nr:hypothetical protein [Gammaproteobacteria bacterium]
RVHTHDAGTATQTVTVNLKNYAGELVLSLDGLAFDKLRVTYRSSRPIIGYINTPKPALLTEPT